MGTYNGYGDAYNVGSVGTTVTSGAASASTAVPNRADGTRARQIRVQATGNAYIKLTKGAGTCTVNDIMLPANMPEVFNTTQFDTISYLQESVAPKINITPLES